MKAFRWVAGILGIWVGLAAVTPSCGSEQDERQFAADLAKRETIQLLTDWKVEIDAKSFKGEVKAVDPEKHVKVEIDELALFQGHTILRLTVASRHLVTGKLIAGHDAVEVTGDIDATSKVSARAEWSIENNRLVIRPRLTSLDIEGKIRQMQPAGDEMKNQAQKLCEALVKQYKDEILREINKRLERRK